MNFDDVRRLSIIAMFSDDRLMDQLVLKGGNALAFVYQIGARASLDVDLSIDGDFDDLEDARDRVFRSLRNTFESVGYVVLDPSFERRPTVEKNPDKRWGGYNVEFKLIEKAKYEEFGEDLHAVRRNAFVTGPLQRKVFRIELSKYEFCEGKTERELDDYTIYVYTPEMIAIEKLRAICQQMDDYQARTKKTARARDFYDIHTLVTKAGVDLSSPENLELTKSIFAAKGVPLALLNKVRESRDQHSPDWPSVVDAVTGGLKLEFKDYFDFVVDQIESMKSLWVE